MKTLFLLGFMGSGKTSIGEMVAANEGMNFIDLDEYIEKRHNKSIAAIFETSGEKKFREYEHQALKIVSGQGNCVIATGGGTPCFYNNMDIINQKGISVYLKLSRKSLFERLRYDNKKRPLLHQSQTNLQQYIERTLDLREKYYQRANKTIDTDSLSKEIVCQKVSLVIRE